MCRPFSLLGRWKQVSAGACHLSLLTNRMPGPLQFVSPSRRARFLLMKIGIALPGPTLMLMLCSLAAGQSVSLAPSHAFANESVDNRIRAELASFKGKVSLFARNLDTGE